MAPIAELLGRTLVVVAHPDDEVIGCGALLQRMREPVLVFCTDGAPRPAKWWQQYQSREAYAEVRRKEARQALGHTSVNHIEFLADGRSEYFVDQELFRRLPDAVIALDGLVRRYRPQALLTHAYEGGHPDHDACCCITSVIAQQGSIPAWEMPLYHRDPDGNATQQQFIHVTGEEVDLKVSVAELTQKELMLEAYASQGDITSVFDTRVERLRPMYLYDFTKPPHQGKLNYELWGWQMTAREVTQAFADYSKGTHREATSST